MAEITFEQLPQAVAQLFSKLENIERLLTNQHSTSPKDSDHWLNLAELCQYLPDRPVKPTVYGWVHNRLIPFNKRGKKLYFLKSDIDLWLKTGRKKTIAEIGTVAENHTSKSRK